MCGIAGILYKNQEQVVDRSLLKKMCDVIGHRGPDGEGFWGERGFGLGHRRLSIIDLATGQQPMSNEDGTIWITYNGEVYNYLELQPDLEKKGHIFKTTCDTETIIHLYEEYGHDCLKYLNGMFSFVIVDTKKNEVFMVRDRLGIKPLYYYEDNQKVLFGSEVKSIIQDKTVPKQIDMEAMGSLFTLGYVPAPKTAYRNIQKLLPGHYMTFKNGVLSKPVQYWDLEFNEDFSMDESQAIDSVRNLLTDSINLRLRSDVPLGVMLSGGLDSSVVVGLLSRQLGKAPQSFSIGYEEGKSQFSELHYAKQVADLYNSKHHALEVPGNVFKDFLPKFSWHFDEPVIEAPAVSLFLVSQLARKHVTVVLSGEGSDEIFGGYGIYKKMMLLETLNKYSGFASKGVMGASRLLSSYPKFSRYLRMMSLPLKERFWGQRRCFWLDQVQPYFTDDFKNTIKDDYLRDLIDGYYKKVEGKSLLNQLLYIDTKTWLPDDILAKSDKMSMANSIELRVPFLDYRLVEKAASIPAALKIKNNQSKYILKKIAGEILPNDIIHRKKMGFPVPLKILFQTQLNEYVRDILLGTASKTRGILNPAMIGNVIDQHTKGQRDHSLLILTCMVFELWAQTFIDG